MRGNFFSIKVAKSWKWDMHKYEQVSSINKISVWTKYGDPSLYDNGEADLTWFQSIKKNKQFCKRPFMYRLGLIKFAV